LSWHLTGLASLSQCPSCLGPTQCCFSECLFLRFCGRLAKFLAELDADTLLLQHIHFTIRRSDKHDCTVDQLTHEWVKLPAAPLVCGVRRCCQVSYMICHFDTISNFSVNNFVPDIFLSDLVH
jgi:hypothetical protein